MGVRKIKDYELIAHNSLFKHFSIFELEFFTFDILFERSIR